MAVKFKVIEKGQPGVVGGGTKKFYASTKLSGETNIELLTAHIERMSTMSGADIRGVLYALVDVATTELSNGSIIRLGDLGSLRLSISSMGMPTEKEVTAGSIKGTKILFTPGKKLKDMQKTVQFQKD
ncbi:HU family DNA-binding protein [Reichenbachiella versicolor]|uniref:HU family DNA-binding protein n=1 Tax=Reichenbachiella versicolor TaxID=1821036 RepID=UPI000D6E8F6C|nr:HU family DNA-binding protein [Reichenbachiella versicolor]